MRRYSKKREAILDCLCSTKSHPTADWIYSQLKPLYPDLSLATVYRNLNMLKNEGRICSVGTVNGQERFDAETSEHPHIICIKCGRMDDIDFLNLPDDTVGSAEKLTGYKILQTSLSFSGICKDCLKDYPQKR